MYIRHFHYIIGSKKPGILDRASAAIVVISRHVSKTKIYL